MPVMMSVILFLMPLDPTPALSSPPSRISQDFSAGQHSRTEKVWGPNPVVTNPAKIAHSVACFVVPEHVDWQEL